jgi:hypothetical protein
MEVLLRLSFGFRDGKRAQAEACATKKEKPRRTRGAMLTEKSIPE